MTTAPFDITPRTRVIFGNGTLVRLGEFATELGGRRALLVTDRGIVAAGHVERARESLVKAGLAVTVFDRVRENPTTADIAQCLAVARDANINVIVGLGGGSSMDTAKGTNFLLTNGGQMRDYWGVGKAPRPMLPLIAVPTTAGTGSECQSAALIADEVTHQKMACLDPKAAAKIAVLDPELTVSQPARVTAVTGTDAIAHAVETTVTTKRNAVSLMYSHEAFKRLVHAFPQVLVDPSDLEARGQMLLGAAFGGTAIEHSMLGAAHACANPLTAHFDIVHGAAVGLMLPHVVRFNAARDEATKRAYAELASAPEIACVSDGLDAAVDALVARIESLLNRAGIPRSLPEAGGNANLIGELAAEAAKQWTSNFNPRPASVDDFAALYRSACESRGSGDGSSG
ncbi:MAG TPA: iron-containing alcohol dehydrogenase [Verrucomicrobiota bacterium]|nr:alcohol dehydrogenase [Verrucomicrobiales bacterium]HRI14692.1 iron-containing alcohol dehydrogenase [Verrucomicrobiota bacterium]